MADLRKVATRRTQNLVLRMFESEARELQRLALNDNRSPGEFLRSLLHAAIRRDKGAEWHPTELDDAGAASSMEKR